MSVGYNPQVVTKNLVLYVDAANFKSYPQSGVTMNNLVNTTEQFALANGVSYSANNKGIIVLDGIDDCLVFNNNTLMDNVSALTVSVFIHKDWANTIAYAPIVSKILNLTTAAGWDLSVAASTNPNKRFSIITSNTGGTPYRQFLTTPLVDVSTRWYCVTASFADKNDYSSYRIYVNGERNQPLVNNSAGGPISTMSTSANLCIGARNAGTADTFGSFYLSGNVAAIQIYDRQLTDTEVQQNFNALRGRFGI